MRKFKAIAPGRLCLFGEHQDYLGLPVIALAIKLYATIEVTPHVEGHETTKKRVLGLQVPQINRSFRYDLDDLPPRQTTLENADFALAVIHEAIDDGWNIPCGATCISTTTIPMQAGCSSSTAFTIAWVLVLAKLCGKDEKLLENPIELARLAHKAEVLHFGAPGGTMDHVSIALGCHCLRIGPGMWDVERLPTLDFSSGAWILADSGDMKDTFGHLKRCKDDRLSLLEEIGGTWNENIPEGKLSDDQLQLLKATLTNRDTEAEATELWREALKDRSTGDAVGRKLGALMLRHHHALRDGLKLSTEKLDAIGEGAMKAGAWGYKLVGSGGGGCAVAWVPSHLASAVTEEMMKAGARNTWIIDTPGKGARIEL